MQKKLLIFLTILVVGLLIANLAVLTIGLQRKLGAKSSSDQASEQVSSVPSSDKSMQIAQAQLNHSFVALSSGVSHLAPASSDQESIGTQAGKTAAELKEKTEKSYEVLNQQAQKTAEELKKTSDQAMQVFTQETAKTAQDLQVTWTEVLKKFNLELEKFNEELKKKQTA